MEWEMRRVVGDSVDTRGRGRLWRCCCGRFGMRDRRTITEGGGVVRRAVVLRSGPVIVSVRIVVVLQQRQRCAPSGRVFDPVRNARYLRARQGDGEQRNRDYPRKR